MIDNFKLGVFELFSAILPGFPMLATLLVIYKPEDFIIENVFSLMYNISLGQCFLIITIAYIIGFALQYISYEIFKKLIKILWRKRIGNYPVSIGKRGKELAKIRHSSPNNYGVLNTFLALRTMCYNMFLSLIFFSITTTIIYCKNLLFSNASTIIIISSLLLAIIFLRRAVSFHEWIQNMITEASNLG